MCENERDKIEFFYILGDTNLNEGYEIQFSKPKDVHITPAPPNHYYSFSSRTKKQKYNKTWTPSLCFLSLWVALYKPQWHLKLYLPNLHRPLNLFWHQFYRSFVFDIVTFSIWEDYIMPFSTIVFFVWKIDIIFEFLSSKSSKTTTLSRVSVKLTLDPVNAQAR